ncbi:MAG: hypothetical protein IPH04_10705 [Saprospirales bacterium]|nr:hypothetical protein [Saprospirales bacterium]
MVTSSANSCIDTAQVLVDIDTMAPTIFAGPDAALTCNDPVVTIGDVPDPPFRVGNTNGSTKTA